MNYDMIAAWVSYDELHIYKNVSFALSDDLASASLDFTQRHRDGDEFSYTIRAQRIETSNKYTGSFTCHHNDEIGDARFSLVNLDDDTKLIWGSLWDENDIKYRWWIELTADD
jgi:hypothetical protein